MLRLLAIAFVAVSSPAWAMCDDYTNGTTTRPAPRAEICFEGACERTTIDYECYNMHGAAIGFANGWKSELDTKRKVGDKYVETFRRDNVLIDARQVSFKRLD
jgi:hypothetical protein